MLTSLIVLVTTAPTPFCSLAVLFSSFFRQSTTTATVIAEKDTTKDSTFPTRRAITGTLQAALMSASGMDDDIQARAHATGWEICPPP